jgi:hypothetical protein
VGAEREIAAKGVDDPSEALEPKPRRDATLEAGDRRLVNPSRFLEAAL